MEQLAQCDFDTKVCMKKHFAIIDVSFNCIYLDGLQAMAEISTLLKKSTSNEHPNLHQIQGAHRVKKEMKKIETLQRRHVFLLCRSKKN